MASNGRDKSVLQRVSKGGFWQSAPLDYSKQTQDLLSEVMKEAKLTLAQQREMKNVLIDPKPIETNKKQFKGKNPFVGSISRKSPSPTTNKTNYGIRTIDTIIKSGCYDIEKKPSTIKYEKPIREKEKLQNLMAFGEDLIQSEKSVEKVEIYPTLKDKFDEIALEIEERRQFLREMKELGVDNQYSIIINNQLAQKLRELELLKLETKN